MIIYHLAKQPAPDVSVLNRFMKNAGGYSRTVNNHTSKLNFPELPISIPSETWDKTSLLVYRNPTHGSIGVKNIAPFIDERLPFYKFAHSGTLTYHINSKSITDSEWFLENILVKDILKEGTVPITSLIGKTHGMRCAGSRFILYSVTQPVLIYGEWYYSKGNYYSSYVEDSIPVGQEDHWTKLEEI